MDDQLLAEKYKTAMKQFQVSLMDAYLAQRRAEEKTVVIATITFIAGVIAGMFVTT